MSVLKVRGELHCYNCGHVSARFEGEKDEHGFRARLLAPSNGPNVRLRAGAPPRCGRCGGRLYVDELEVVRPAPVAAPTPVELVQSLYHLPATSLVSPRR